MRRSEAAKQAIPNPTVRPPFPDPPLPVRELIAALHSLQVETGSLACMGCEHEKHCAARGCKIIRDAERMLREQTANPFLTYDQMKERVHEHAPVFVIDGCGMGRWALVIEGSPQTLEGFKYPCGVDFNALDGDEETLDGDHYLLRELGGGQHCMGWIAFDRKPTVQEVMAAGWEWEVNGVADQ